MPNVYASVKRTKHIDDEWPIPYGGMDTENFGKCKTNVEDASDFDKPVFVVDGPANGK